jgi:ACT domain-containing protein
VDLTISEFIKYRDLIVVMWDGRDNNEVSDVTEVEVNLGQIAGWV